MGVIDDLRTLAASLEAGDAEARFVGSELRLVETGCVRAAAANREADYLGAVMWKRLALESTIRISWIVGDAFEADDAGELMVASAEVRLRCQRLKARDVLNLLSTYKSISNNQGSTDAELVEGMERLASSRAVVPAPRSISDLAIHPTQRALYAQFRLCSSVVHPGELAASQSAREKASVLVDEVAVMGVTFARSVLRTLAS